MNDAFVIHVERPIFEAAAALGHLAEEGADHGDLPLPPLWPMIVHLAAGDVASHLAVTESSHKDIHGAMRAARSHMMSRWQRAQEVGIRIFNEAFAMDCDVFVHEHALHADALPPIVNLMKMAEDTALLLQCIEAVDTMMAYSHRVLGIEDCFFECGLPAALVRLVDLRDEELRLRSFELLIEMAESNSAAEHLESFLPWALDAALTPGRFWSGRAVEIVAAVCLTAAPEQLVTTYPQVMLVAAATDNDWTCIAAIRVVCLHRLLAAPHKLVIDAAISAGALHLVRFALLECADEDTRKDAMQVLAQIMTTEGGTVAVVDAGMLPIVVKTLHDFRQAFVACAVRGLRSVLRWAISNPALMSKIAESGSIKETLLPMLVLRDTSTEGYWTFAGLLRIAGGDAEMLRAMLVGDAAISMLQSAQQDAQNNEAAAVVLEAMEWLRTPSPGVSAEVAQLAQRSLVAQQ